MRERERDVKKIGFCLINSEIGCFNILSLFHLSKMHVLVIYSIPLNITVKVTLKCKV